MNELVNKIRNEEWNLVLVDFYGRSGSMLFHSLLDGHPDLIVLPNAFLFNDFNKKMAMPVAGGGCFMDAIKGVVPRALKSKLKEKFILSEKSKSDDTVKHLLEHYIEKYAWLILNLCNSTPGMEEYMMLGDPIRKYSLDTRLMISKIREIWGNTELSFVEFIRTMCLVYHMQATGFIPGRNQNYVVYQQHSKKIKHETGVLLKLFDKFIRVVTIRDPIVSFSSSLRNLFLQKSNMGRIDYNCYIISAFIDFLYNGVCINGELSMPSIAVRFEDFHRDTRDTMMSFVEYIGVAWNEVLTRPTMLGETWWWPSGKGDYVSGINKNASNNFHKEIVSDLDRDKLVCVVKKRYLAWNYPIDAHMDYKIRNSFDFTQNMTQSKLDSFVLNLKISKIIEEFERSEKNICYVRPLQ